jgi:hypothetical protein
MPGWCLALSNERLKLKQMFEPARPGVLKNRGVWRKQSRAAPVPERRTSTPVETVLRDVGRTGHHSRAGLIENKQNYGYLCLRDAQEGQYGDLVSKGIIDPTKVVRTALQDAASIGGLLVTTEAMVAEKPKKETPPMPEQERGFIASPVG